MNRPDLEKKKRKPVKGRSIFKEIGARIVKSLLFWGMVTILASSIYGEVNRPGKRSPDRIPAGSQSIRTAGERKMTAETGTVTEPEAAGESEAAGGPETEGKQEIAGRVALTFDDGPHPVYTEKLLDGLKERNVRATFFVVGKNIPGNEELIRRMDQEGHLIGNHTYDHVKICDMTGENACRQVEKTSSLIREITGCDTEFVRPPFGAWNKSMECSFVMIPVLWDVDPLDWTTRNVSTVVSRVLTEAEDGDIILLHDYYDSSVEAALQIADRLSAGGYEFVTVDELILE